MFYIRRENTKFMVSEVCRVDFVKSFLGATNSLIIKIMKKLRKITVLYPVFEKSLFV